MNRRDVIGNTKIKNIPGKIRKKIGPSVKKGIKTVKSFVRGAKSGVKNMTVADAIMNTVAPGSTIIREGVKQVLKKPDKVKVYNPPGKPPKSTTISGPFRMKGFSGFGNESPAKMKFDPARDVVNFREGVAYTPKGKVKANINVDKISKRPASTFDKSLGNARNSAKQQRKAMGKVGRKVAGKIGSKFLGPVGVGLAVKDAIGSYKDIKKGMKPGKALRKNFLGF